MTVTLPESIAAMNAKTELKQGVFSLVEKLNGKKMLADNWKDARQYSEALTMAAVARGDYVVLMHDLWDHFFKAEAINPLGTIDPDPSDYPPSEIWGHYEIGKSIKLHAPFEQVTDLSLYFGYNLETQKFQFSVGAFGEKDKQIPVPSGLKKLGGWYLKFEEDWVEQFLYSPQIDAAVFRIGVGNAVEVASQLLTAIRKLGK